MSATTTALTTSASTGCRSITPRISSPVNPFPAFSVSADWSTPPPAATPARCSRSSLESSGKRIPLQLQNLFNKGTGILVSDNRSTLLTSRKAPNESCSPKNFGLMIFIAILKATPQILKTEYLLWQAQYPMSNLLSSPLQMRE